MRILSATGFCQVAAVASLARSVAQPLLAILTAIVGAIKNAMAAKS